MLIIVHGWSGSAASFQTIANRIVGAVPGLGPVANIWLADYISLDDNVTFADLRVAMQRAWQEKELSVAPRSVNVLVHSTGALVVRDWMTAYFQPETNPVKRLVMLAPANFGSPLAAKARSFIGRVIKGFNATHPGQTGTQLLKGLELASPYSWQLAMIDRFDPMKRWYGPDRVLCTVLVGTAGYSGIRALANSVGSDGTVRVSTANLNPHRIVVDFSSDPQHPVWRSTDYNGQTAFLRIPGENHESISQGGSVAGTLERIIASLEVDDGDFDGWRQELDTASEAARKQEETKAYTQGYQNTAIHLVDNLAQPVTDYLIEAYVPRQPRETQLPADVDEEATQYLQENILLDAHSYCDDGSFRALLFNCTEIQKYLIANNRNLELSVTAHPQVAEGSAGYRTFGFNDVGGIFLTPDQQSDLFSPDRTLLIEMTIRREQQGIFSFKPALVHAGG